MKSLYRYGAGDLEFKNPSLLIEIGLELLELLCSNALKVAFQERSQINVKTMVIHNN